MNIIISQGHQPPANALGVTVVIDVIRAFTTAHHAFQQGASRIWPVATAEEAFSLKQQLPNALLAGEVDALPIDGFDFGNSPWEVSQTEFNHRPLIMRTTNGVIATLNAQPCAHLFVTGLASASATAKAVMALSPPQVVLVASHPTGDEDVACAQYIKGLLGGEGISAEEAQQRTLNAKAAVKFFNQSNPRLRAADIEMAAQCDIANFAMRVHNTNKDLFILPEPI